MRIHIQKVHLGRSNYRNEYLKSEEWARLRAKIISRATEQKCEKCRQSPATDVHHMDYRFLAVPGFETRNQLIALCRECHDLVEDAKKLKLIPEPHLRAHIYRLTKEQVKEARRQKRKKVLWDERLSSLVASLSVQGQRLICGILCKSPPLFWREWDGMKLTAAQKEKIDGVLSRHLPDKKIAHKIKLRQRGWTGGIKLSNLDT